ncbi:hypothetical protein [Virgibacillus salinus]|uniref:Uncharacterized protein n=1 Tax=Virgibacillus salinus TaxID=553311 RepID=A0A1H1F0A1_9BACI|nr:hypothetical protein [Virgibacillus salinus]SDQ94382.1 hypothetical protein SAMN05216231_3139 [Virgibacillus salinus]
MSEQNKNHNRDTGKQQNVLKYDTEPKREKNDTDIAEDTEFLNQENKRNKRKR